MFCSVWEQGEEADGQGKDEYSCAAGVSTAGMSFLLLKCHNVFSQRCSACKAILVLDAFFGNMAIVNTASHQVFMFIYIRSLNMSTVDNKKW